MKTKTTHTHTPGPWTWSGAGAKTRLCVFARADALPNDRVIADLRSDDKRAEADARLITAAPDMLAALREFVQGDYPAAHVRAKLAIAKAEGRT